MSYQTLYFEVFAFEVFAGEVGRINGNNKYRSVVENSSMEKYLSYIY